MTVRAAWPAERPAVLNALVEAFSREAFSVWRFPDPTVRRAALVDHFTEDLDADRHEVEVTQELSGVALWRTVDPGAPGPRRSFDGLEPRAAEALTRVYARAPQEVHRYLGFLAAPVPGTGAGTRLLEHGLAAADARSVSVALWTASDRNVGFYRRFGFAVSTTVELETLTATWLWRPARA